MKWTVPKIWEGSTAFIIGGGPSLETMDWAPLRSHRIIGCNDAYMLGPWVDVCMFGDISWFNTHDHKWIEFPEGVEAPSWAHKANCRKVAGLKQFYGLKVTCCERDIELEGPRSDIFQLERMPRGLSLRPDRVGWNCNTGAAAINLAILFGVTRIILLGFDMKGRKWKDEEEKKQERIIAEEYHSVPERDALLYRIRSAQRNGFENPDEFKPNWHPNLKNHCNPEQYKKFLTDFEHVATDLKKIDGVEVLNATEGSRLTLFPMVELGDVL